MRLRCNASPFSHDHVARAKFNAAHAGFTSEVAASRTLHKAPVTRRAMLGYGAVLERQVQKNLRSSRLGLLRDDDGDVMISGDTDDQLYDIADIYRGICPKSSQTLGLATASVSRAKKPLGKKRGFLETQQRRVQSCLDDQSLATFLMFLLLVDLALLALSMANAEPTFMPWAWTNLLAFVLVSVFGVEVFLKAFAKFGRQEFEIVDRVDALVVYLSIILMAPATFSGGGSDGGGGGMLIIRLVRVVRLARPVRLFIRFYVTAQSVRRARAARTHSLFYFLDLSGNYEHSGRMSDFVVATQLEEHYTRWLDDIGIDKERAEPMRKDTLQQRYGLKADVLSWPQVAVERHQLTLQVREGTYQKIIVRIKQDFEVVVAQLVWVLLPTALLVAWSILFETDHFLVDVEMSLMIEAREKTFTRLQMNTRPWLILFGIGDKQPAPVGVLIVACVYGAFGLLVFLVQNVAGSRSSDGNDEAHDQEMDAGIDEEDAEDEATDEAVATETGVSNSDQSMETVETIARKVVDALSLVTILKSDTHALPIVLHAVCAKLSKKPGQCMALQDKESDTKLLQKGENVVYRARHTVGFGACGVSFTWTTPWKKLAMIGTVDEITTHAARGSQVFPVGSSFFPDGKPKVSQVILRPKPFRPPLYGLVECRDSFFSLKKESADVNDHKQTNAGCVQFSDVYKVQPRDLSACKQELARARVMRNKQKQSTVNRVCHAASSTMSYLFAATLFLCSTLIFGYFVLVTIWWLLGTITNPSSYLTYATSVIAFFVFAMLASAGLIRARNTIKKVSSFGFVSPRFVLTAFAILSTVLRFDAPETHQGATHRSHGRTFERHRRRQNR